MERDGSKPPVPYNGTGSGPTFLGGSCPLGCSLSAPATGGCSVFSLQCSMYAAGSEKEKRAGCPLHGAIIAQLFVFCNRGWQGPLTPASARRRGRMVLSWPAPSISEGSGLACAVVPPAHPPTLLETGGLAVPPAGAAPPAPCLGDGTLPNLSPSTGAGTEASRGHPGRKRGAAPGLSLVL